MTVDSRALRLLVVSAWSLFLLWLWLSDEVLRYLGPRTEWVAPVGGLLLALVAAAYSRAITPEPAVRPSAVEVLGTVALLAPIVLALFLSGASLGSLAASKKLTSRGVDLAALARLDAGRSGEVSFLDLEGAGRDSQLAREKDIRPGRSVTLTGFVSRPAANRDEGFELARFYITCCVADAIPVGVTVEPPAQARRSPRKDEWLTVTGSIVRSGEHFGVQALRITHTTEPSDPYLSFGS
ncbi:MAG TPA: TIGR03943 family protein [Thermoleophilaceae bacterium]|nr:TIGR03943 family protein [Thermoleophilaceae bacterium]